MKYVLAAIVVGIGAWVYFSIHPLSKSNAQKLSDCKVSAVKLEESEMAAIDKSTSNKNDPRYITVSQAYQQNLQNCQQLYGN